VLSIAPLSYHRAQALCIGRVVRAEPKSQLREAIAKLETEVGAEIAPSEPVRAIERSQLRSSPSEASDGSLCCDNGAGSAERIGSSETE